MKNKSQKYTKILTAIAVSVFLVTGVNFTFAQNADPQTDAISPSDVENLKALAGDQEVQLSWDAATDNVGIVGYKIYRSTHTVKTENDSYDLPVIPVGNVTAYTVKNLTNEQAYYFSITAVDSSGNESVNYALESNAKPQAGLHLAAIEDNGKTPQVKEVKSVDIITAKVIFSESIKLPLEQPASAFKIEKTLDKSQLIIQKAEIDSTDSTGATVLLTTAPQEENAEYVLTAGIEIQDYFNSPIVSGTFDTGSFKGSAAKKQDSKSAGNEDKQAPAVSSVIADYNNRIAIAFSEKITLPENATSKFSILKKGAQTALKILNVSLSVDEKSIYLITDPQEKTEYEVKAPEIQDIAGNKLTAGTLTVTGMPPSLKDLVPPEDVAKLIAKIKDAEKNIVELSWQASKNSAGDLSDQVLYHALGKNAKEFKEGAALGSSAINAQVQDLQQGNWYTFKVTTKDTSGNESKGAIKALYLPKTGPGVVAAGLTALVMGWYSRKKRQ